MIQRLKLSPPLAKQPQTFLLLFALFLVGQSSDTFANGDITVSQNASQMSEGSGNPSVNTRTTQMQLVKINGLTYEAGVRLGLPVKALIRAKNLNRVKSLSETAVNSGGHEVKHGE